MGANDEGAILRLHDRSAGAEPASRGECVLDVGGRRRAGARRPVGAEARPRTPERTSGCSTSPPPAPSASSSPGGRRPTTHPRRRCSDCSAGRSGTRRPGSRRRRTRWRVTRSAPATSGRRWDSRPWPSGSRRTGIRRAPTPVALAARRFDRVLDTEWRRTSYSGLTAAAHGSEPAVAGVASEPEPAKEDDEAAAPAESDGLLAAPSPDTELDAALTDGRSAGRRRVRCRGPRRAGGGRPPGGRPGRRAASCWSEHARPAADGDLHRRPAGRRSGARIRHTARSARRGADVWATFPAATGWPSSASSCRWPAATVTRAELLLADLVPLLREHLPADDPLAAYPDALAEPGLAGQPSAAILTGSIDAVLRMPGPDGGPRYLVVDYKTNWLGPLGRPAADRRAVHPGRMADAMMHAHYPLQALLYAVAVHRLLRWRQPGLRPRAAPRRRALPVRPRHGRPGHPGRGRGALRRVQLAAAGGPGRRRCPTCWTGRPA